jgi:hypothetical protein
MTCHGCPSTLQPWQVYRGNRYCSVRCANADCAVGPREWPAVLALLGTEWFVTLSDIALLRYGDDTPADLAAARGSIASIRRAGYVLEHRDFPWPGTGRQSIRGYRLAPLPAGGGAA